METRMVTRRLMILLAYDSSSRGAVNSNPPLLQGRALHTLRTEKSEADAYADQCRGQHAGPPGSAGVPPAGGGRCTDFDFDPAISISMTSRPLMVGAALAAAQVLQPVSSVCQAEPSGEGAGGRLCRKVGIIMP